MFPLFESIKIENGKIFLTEFHQKRMDKTLEIIKSVELDERGYYSGIYGYFDGETLDSAVNIRYIENTDSNGLYFRSGGGITSNSKFEDEFDELIKKIYVPTI